MLVTRTSAQAPASFNSTLTSPWGEPDLQGIWTEEFDTPLLRPTRFGNQEFFTEAQRQELDRQRAAHYGDDPRQQRGSAVDVGGAYNTAFLTMAIASGLTSAITNPLHAEVMQACLGADVMMGHDPHCARWIEKYREQPAPGTAGTEGAARGRREGGSRRRG